MFDGIVRLETETQIVHPALARIYGYWAMRCEGRWAPARADLDPAELGRLLPYIVLIEPLDEGPLPGGCDYRLRLIGDHILDGYRLPRAPRLLSDLPDGRARQLMLYQYQRLVSERQSMHYGPATSVMPGREHMTTEHIDMPLSANGQRVDLILAGVVILSDREWCRDIGEFTPPPLPSPG